MIDERLLTYLEEFVTPARRARFLEVLEHRTKYLTVAIEDVFQAHNTSAVIRSCEVFGIQEAHYIENRFGKRVDKNIALGAEKWVDLYRYSDTEQCLGHLREDGYKIIATTPHYDSCLLEDFQFDGKTALFFGTEKEGLSKEVMETADGYLKIPMVGFTESLNISVSAAIILQQLSADLRNSGLPWQLTPQEKREKLLDWTKKSIRSLDDVLSRYDRG